jgi:hypothetical protein
MTVPRKTVFSGFVIVLLTAEKMAVQPEQLYLLDFPSLTPCE